LPEIALGLASGGETFGGRALIGLGAPKGYRTRSNSECQTWMPGSHTVGDKLHGREGNSPDRQLRPPSSGLVGKDVGSQRQPGGWLRSSHSFKECVIAHWSSDPAPKIQRGSSRTPKLWIRWMPDGRGAFRAALKRYRKAPWSARK